MNYYFLGKLREAPDILTKTTFIVSPVVFLILFPFSINSFIQGRLLLGFLTAFILTLLSINIWLCKKGEYNFYINLAVAFTIVVTTINGILVLNIGGTYWAYIVALSFYFSLPLKHALSFNIVYFIILLPVTYYALDFSIFVRFNAVFIMISAFIFLSTKTIHEQYELLKKQTITDALTGLLNRSLLQSSLEHAMHQFSRTKAKATILMLDIDYFKDINDSYGHEIGDLVLKSLGDHMKNSFRGDDLVFRIGGEEFMVLIKNSDHSNSLIIAEKLRTDIQQLPLIPNHTVTVSIGVSSIQQNDNWKEWMKKSDENLYRAKSLGRNQVAG